VVASVETGSLVGNRLGHQTVCFVNYLVKIRKNIEKRMRMNVEKFDELLRLVESYECMSKTDTVMKAAIHARLKLEVTLRFLASGGFLFITSLII